MPNEESKTIKNIFVIFMIVGLTVFFIGLALSVKMIFLDKMGKEKTTAKIVNITNSSTTVVYTVNNLNFTKTDSVYSSSYYIGKEVKVYYNKVNPNKSYIANMQYIILVVPLIGIVFLGISGIGLIYIYFKYYKI